MKKRHFILKGIITALVLIVLFYTGRWAFFNIFHRQDVVDGMVALRTNVMHSMEDGNDSDIFYVKNVKIKDISDINKYVDSAFGSVDTYRVLVSSGDYLAIQLSFDRSENYYVIRKVLFDEEIPSDKKKALAMYDSYIEFSSSFLKKHSGSNIFPYLDSNYIPTFSAVCVKKEVIQNINFSTPYPAWLDFWLWRQICVFNKVYYIPQELTLWRKHNESYDAVSDNKDFNGFIKSSDQYLVSQYSLSQIIANANIPKDKKSLKQFIRSFCHFISFKNE